VIVVASVWYSSHVGQLEVVITSWKSRTELTQFVEKSRVGVFHQHVSEESPWLWLIKRLLGKNVNSKFSYEEFDCR
jgi:hypothetical protein